MITLPHNISALMRRRAIRTAMIAVLGVTGAVRGNRLAAYCGFSRRCAFGSGSC